MTSRTLLLYGLIFCHSPGNAHYLLDTEIIVEEKWRPDAIHLHSILPTRALLKSLPVNVYETITVMPLFSTTTTSVPAPTGLPQPMPGAAFESLPAQDNFDDMLSSIAPFADITGQPMSLSGSLQSLPAFYPDQNTLSDQLTSLAVNTEGATTTTISMTELATAYPYVHQLIIYIQEELPHLASSFNLNNEYYLYSPTLLEMLNVVIYENMSENSGFSTAFMGLFRHFMSGLKLNYLWPVTNRVLLKKLLDMCFTSGKNRQLFSMLEQMESLQEYLQQSGVITEKTLLIYQMHILQLIAEHIEKPEIQSLLGSGAYAAAFLAIIVQSPHVQKRFRFGQNLTGLLANFSLRQRRYKHLYQTMIQYLTGLSASEEHAELFFNYLLHLIRSDLPCFMSLGHDIEHPFECIPASPDTLLSLLDAYAETHPQQAGTTLQIVSTPQLFQTASVFVAHAQQLQHSKPVILDLIHQLHIQPLPTLNNGVINLSELYYWGLLAMAQTTSLVAAEDQHCAQVIHVMHKPFQHHSGCYVQIAQHLTQMITTHAPSTWNILNITGVLDSASIFRFLNGFVLGHYLPKTYRKK